jgi:uncharacterized protein YdeI (YjbR/CyaY-like superfamily)
MPRSQKIPPEHKSKPTLYLPTRAAWRTWLQKNHTASTGIWLVYPNQSTGHPRIPYADAVEEALCFGWIDSVINKLNPTHACQWFCPRKPKGTWSALNKKRVAQLIAQGLMTPAGLAHVKAAQADGRWTALDANERLELPKDLAQLLTPKSLTHWNSLSPSTRKALLNHLSSAKKEKTRTRRLEKILTFVTAGKRNLREF